MTLSYVNKTNESPWWRLPVSTCLSLAGLASLSLACCLRPILVDRIAMGLVRSVDFRFWPWWFFLELAMALAFSIRWFLILSDRYNGKPPEPKHAETNRFLELTGMICLIMLLISLLDRFSLLPAMLNSLFAWFGSGTFSVLGLLSSVGLAVLLIRLVTLTRSWILTLQRN